MAIHWFIVRDGKEHGPFSGQQLKEMAATGKLQPDDKVRRDDMQAASKASAIKGLFASVEVTPAKPPAPTSSETPPPATKTGPSKKTLIIASAAAGAFLLLCCGGLGVVGLLAPNRPDATTKEVANGGAPSDTGSKAQADQQQAKPAGSPQVVKFFKGGNREPLEVRVLATDEIEIIPAYPTVNGFKVNFDVRWKKPVDKDNPSRPWRYTIFNKKGEKLGEGEVGTKDKFVRAYDADVQSGQIVISWIALNRENFEDAARIDIHR